MILIINKESPLGTVGHIRLAMRIRKLGYATGLTQPSLSFYWIRILSILVCIKKHSLCDSCAVTKRYLLSTNVIFFISRRIAFGQK